LRSKPVSWMPRVRHHRSHSSSRGLPGGHDLGPPAEDHRKVLGRPAPGPLPLPRERLVHELVEPTVVVHLEGLLPDGRELERVRPGGHDHMDLGRLEARDDHLSLAARGHAEELVGHQPDAIPGRQLFGKPVPGAGVRAAVSLVLAPDMLKRVEVVEAVGPGVQNALLA
jgi:hypothetical protein